jgi:tetratricopeptide (TPR) repeat protein
MPAQPVSGAPDGVDWFAPATDPRMQLPDRAKIGPTEDEDTPAEAELIEVEPAAAEPIDAESTQDVSTQDVLSLVEPAATHQTDAEPIRVEPTPSGETAGTVTGGTFGDSELDVATKQPESGSAADVAKTEADDDHVETDTSKVGETTADVGGTTAEIAPTGEVELEKLEEEPERRLVDPEQVLAAYAWRFDPETLREQADDPDQLRAVRDRLTDKLEYAERHAVRARLLSLRAVIGRVLGDYGRAVADGRMALKHAEATGELRRISIAQARLAHVLQWRGDYAAADRMFEEANSAELPDRLRSEMSELAGRSAYEQGRYLEAVNHFERALDVRRGEDTQLIARIEQALDAVQGKIHAKEDWGPYPRTREELLQQPGALHPTLGFESQLWGYADHDGELIIPERYADARPFHDGVAWVLRPQGRAWELIDAEGTVLIDQFSGYLAVGPFAEGLAWVSRDATGGWFAINRDNRVIVAGGFDDVRSFHSGLAPVRRVGWGAVDRHGRLVVQPKFLGFATALTSGRHLDGFTDEGHAVVDAGDRKGVVDRTGNLIVPPVHPALLIHPVAFVIGGRDGRWGALDRQGAPLIDVVHASQAEVADEIDRLLADTRPVL